LKGKIGSEGMVNAYQAVQAAKGGRDILEPTLQ
jgi:hypothetical protein